MFLVDLYNNLSQVNLINFCKSVTTKLCNVGVLINEEIELTIFLNFIWWIQMGRKELGGYARWGRVLLGCVLAVRRARINRAESKSGVLDPAKWENTWILCWFWYWGEAIFTALRDTGRMGRAFRPEMGPVRWAEVGIRPEIDTCCGAEDFWANWISLFFGAIERELEILIKQLIKSLLHIYSRTLR